MTATHEQHLSTTAARLHLAFELGLEPVEAGLHHRPRPTGQAAQHRSTRFARVAQGNCQGQAVRNVTAEKNGLGLHKNSKSNSK
jgi:hypothetical protein